MNCDEVLRSRWSTWFGLPVALPAFAMYGTLVCVLAFAGPIAPDNVRRLAWFAISAMAAMAAAAGLCFMGIQLFVVKELCTWCVTVHVCGCGLFLLTLAGGAFPLTSKLLPMGLATAIGMALLATGQYFQPERESGLTAEIFGMNTSVPYRPGGCSVANTSLEDIAKVSSDDDSSSASDGGSSISFSDLDGFRVTPSEVDGADEPAPPSIGEVSPPDAPLIPVVPAAEPSDSIGVDDERERIINVLGGKVELNAYRYPVLGSYEAEHVIVKLFDYTCPHCREMHKHLEEVQAASRGNVSVLMLSVPLNADCNSQVQRTSSRHKDACQLSALALAVWHLKPEAFAEYNEYLMTGHFAPDVASAKAKAASVVGQAQLDTLLADPRLWRHLAVGPTVYGLAGRGVVPKLLLPKVLITGNATGREELFEMLSRHLEMPELKP